MESLSVGTCLRFSSWLDGGGIEPLSSHGKRTLPWLMLTSVPQEVGHQALPTSNHGDIGCSTLRGSSYKVVYHFSLSHCYQYGLMNIFSDLIQY